MLPSSSALVFSHLILNVWTIIFSTSTHSLPIFSHFALCSHFHHYPFSSCDSLLFSCFHHSPCLAMCPPSYISPCPRCALTSLFSLCSFFSLPPSCQIKPVAMAVASLTQSDPIWILLLIGGSWFPASEYPPPYQLLSATVIQRLSHNTITIRCTFQEQTTLHEKPKSVLHDALGKVLKIPNKRVLLWWPYS